jgi:hypothetical protein
MKKTIIILFIFILMAALPHQFVKAASRKTPDFFPPYYGVPSNGRSYGKLYYVYPEKMVVKQADWDIFSLPNEYTMAEYSQIEQDMLLEAEVFKALDALPNLQVREQASKAKIDYSFITTDVGYSLWPRYFELRLNELKFNGTPYLITHQQYEDLKDVLAKAEKNRVAFPRWLIESGLDRMIAVRSKEKGQTWEFDTDAASSYGHTMNLLRNVFPTYSAVLEDTFKRYKKTVVGRYKDAFEMRLIFSANDFLDIVVQGDTLFLEKSDEDYVCAYTLKQPERFLTGLRDNSKPN